MLFMQSVSIEAGAATMILKGLRESLDGGGSSLAAYFIFRKARQTL